MADQNPTKKQHFVPIVYLEGFSPDGKHIYEYNLEEGAIEVHVRIEDVCRENFLYEVRDNDGEIFNINFLEKKLCSFEGLFSAYRKRLLSKACYTENRKTNSFLSKEEKDFWRFYATLQIMRLPSIINGLTEIMHGEMSAGHTDYEARNNAIAACLPFFDDADRGENSPFMFHFKMLHGKAIIIGCSKNDDLLTSDQPLYGTKDPDDPFNFNQLCFPISSGCALFFYDPAFLPEGTRNKLVELTEDEVKKTNKGIAYNARKIVLSKKPFTKDDIALIKEARNDRAEDELRKAGNS